MAVDRIGDVLGALADPTRRQILDMLSVTGAATATTLAAELPISRQAVLKHLVVLDRAGLVIGTREGREVRYRVHPQSLDTTAQWMTRLADQWAGRLRVIKQLAEAAED
jgi:DNA-binding transcriptional ArsR family regulator